MSRQPPPIEPTVPQRRAARPRKPEQTLDEGELLAGRYRIIRFIAAGGMGEVYQARDEALGVDVAVKTLLAEIADSPRLKQRFLREIQLARKVTHPNVCRIFDLGQHTRSDGRPLQFLTMELLLAETLAQRLRRTQALAVGEALALARQMACGLDAAHEAGVIDRDFKCANVLLVEDRSGDRPTRAILTDFGLARDQDQATMDGGSMTSCAGTPAYMAPEQCPGAKLTRAVDIYAFGVVLHVMASGRLPSQSATLPAGWQPVIARCLETAPEARFARAGDVVAALDAGAAAAPAREPARAPGEQRHGRRLVVLAVASTLLVASAGVVWLRGARAPVAAHTAELAATPDGRRDLSPETLATLRRHFEGDVLLSGSYLVLEGAHGAAGGLRVDLQLQDGATGELLAAVSEIDPTAPLAEVLARADARLRRRVAQRAAPAAPR